MVEFYVTPIAYKNFQNILMFWFPYIYIYTSGTKITSVHLYVRVNFLSVKKAHNA